MRFRHNQLPVDYSKCNQFITVYHADLKAGNITAMNIPHAFFDFRKNEMVNRYGQTESNSFLLVIPKKLNNLPFQPVYNGDKVILWTDGVPESIFTADDDEYLTSQGEVYTITTNDPITTRSQWAEFIPSKYPNMTVVKYVDPKYWNGEIAHWEAGG